MRAKGRSLTVPAALLVALPAEPAIGLQRTAPFPHLMNRAIVHHDGEW